MLDILRTSAASIFHAYAEGQKNSKKIYPWNAGSLTSYPEVGRSSHFQAGSGIATSNKLSTD